MSDVAAVDAPAKRSRSNTKPRLLDGACRVFVDKGFTAATVEDICDAAGFTRGAFYSNFASKDELFLALWDRQAGTIVDTLRALAVELRGAPERTDEILDAMARPSLYDRDRILLNAEFLLYVLRNPEAADCLAEHRAALRREIGEIVLTVFASRGAPPPADLDQFCRLVIAAVEGGQNQSLLEPNDPASQATTRRLFDLLLGSTGGPR